MPSGGPQCAALLSLATHSKAAQQETRAAAAVPWIDRRKQQRETRRMPGAAGSRLRPACKTVGQAAAGRGPQYPRHQELASSARLGSRAETKKHQESGWLQIQMKSTWGTHTAAMPTLQQRRGKGKAGEIPGGPSGPPAISTGVTQLGRMWCSGGAR